MLNARKELLKIRIYINQAAFTIIKNKAFEYGTILIILVNSATLGMEDPL